MILTIHNFSLNGSINGSLDEESGFGDAQETTQGEFQVHITKQICKFVDKVCTESSIKSEHTKTLVSKIPGLVHMQVNFLIFVSLYLISFELLLK